MRSRTEGETEMDKKILSFGEIMLRLTPPDRQLIDSATVFQACYGGSESNVLVCLSHLGNQTDYLTALPQNELGDATVRHLRAHGVGTENIIRGGSNLGMYFLEEGFGGRPTKVIYNRKYSQVSMLDAGAFDYDRVFENCGLFHICGISFAISDSARRLSFELVGEAKKRGIPVSFDFNYRGKLWTTDEAAEVYREIVKQVDILFCSELDLKTFLGTDREHFSAVYEGKYCIIREREVLSGDRHAAWAELFCRTEGGVRSAVADRVEFPVLERIGSGDAFVGGVLHGLLSDGENLAEALKWGMACFVLKHTQRGDVFTQGDVAALTVWSDLSKDVTR